MTPPDRTESTLDGQLGFALHAASRAMTARYRPLLAAIGLTYPQYVVMLLLWERGSATVGELGESLQLDSATLSPLLKRLAVRGLLTRARRTQDERTLQVTITDRGRDLEVRARAVQGRVEAATRLARPDLEALRDELHAVARRLRAGGR
jgi:MarR family transcriptional regulator, organic hydroperoxide resistance regulator